MNPGRASSIFNINISLQTVIFIAFLYFCVRSYIAHDEVRVPTTERVWCHWGNKCGCTATCPCRELLSIVSLKCHVLAFAEQLYGILTIQKHLCSLEVSVTIRFFVKPKPLLPTVRSRAPGFSKFALI